MLYYGTFCDRYLLQKYSISSVFVRNYRDAVVGILFFIAFNLSIILLSYIFCIEGANHTISKFIL